MVILLKTRSVWVRIFLLSIAAIILISLFLKKFGVSVKARNIISLTAIIVVVAGGTLINLAGKKGPWSFFGKLRSIANPEPGNNAFRLKIWILTTDMIVDHPITVVRAGNWKLHSPKYYNKFGYNFKKNQLNWVRPHNDYLGVFAEKGIFGFLLFLAIFGFAIAYMLKLFFSNVRLEQKILSLVLLSGLICYLTVSFFTFPLERISQQAYLAFILASVVTLYHAAVKTKSRLPIQKSYFIPLWYYCNGSYLLLCHD